MRSMLLALLTIRSLALAAQSDDAWPQFRGPRGDGTSLATNLPLTWSETNNIAWKSAVPGRGRSSPVVLDARIWLTTATEQDVRRTRIGSDDMQTAEHVSLGVVCLDRADGRILWHVTLFEVEKPDPVHWFNSWATPTPVIEPGRLYCDFGTFGTACLEASTGKVLWQQRLPLDHQVGPGSSPILCENLLVLVRDGRDAQYVAALDKRTGQTVWKTARPPVDVPSGNLKKSFSTPLLVQCNGRTQLVATGPHWIVSYAPDTGKEFWRFRHGQGFSIGTCPVFNHDLVFFGTGCFKAQLFAIRADGQGDLNDASVVWKTVRQIPVMSSPVLAADDIYWVSDDGVACGADARTGQVHWQERLGGSHLASPLSAEGRLYFFDMDGKATVLRAGKEFVKLAENTLEGPLVATPAMANRTIFVRTDSHLYCVATGLSR